MHIFSSDARVPEIQKSRKQHCVYWGVAVWYSIHCVKNGENYFFLCVDKMLFILISELSFKFLFLSFWLLYLFESLKSCILYFLSTLLFQVYLQTPYFEV